MLNYRREGSFDKFHQAQNARVTEEYVDAEAHNRFIDAINFAPASATASGPAGGDLAGTYPNPTIASHAVTGAKFRQGVATSLVGVAGGSTADVADIAASADGTFLKRTSGSLGFTALAAADVPVMVAAGGSHSPGLVPDSGATAHSPAYVLTDAALWATGSPYQGQYHPDRYPGSSVLATSQSDEFDGGLTVGWTSFNSGEGLTVIGEIDTALFKQTSGTASHIYRGLVIAPPAGDWLFATRMSNEQATRSGNGPGQAGLVFGVGGSLATPSSSEFLRYGSAIVIDHANNSGGTAYAVASSVRASGSLPSSSWSAAPSWVYAAARYTSSSKLLETFYSITGRSWIALGSTTLGSAVVSLGVFLDSFSTTILPALRLQFLRVFSDATRISNLRIGA